MIYVLDTNTISQWLHPQDQSIQPHVDQAMRAKQRLLLCQPVYYELMRGFLWRAVPRKLTFLHQVVITFLEFAQMQDADWLQAAKFWANARQQGHQLSDVDTLIAAIAHRLKATIVSSDTDFDILPVPREDWTTP